MVFPRNAGFGRYYLVSTRHEILSNIDRYLTGTLLRLRKKRNKINPARVRIPSWFYCCHLSLKQLFDCNLTKFKKFIIKKLYFHNQTCQHSTWQRLVVGDSPRGQLGPGIGQARIHTSFHRFTEIGRILVIKMLSKLKSGKCWTRLASYPLQYGNWPWWNNPAICKASSEENGTGQYSGPHEKRTLGPELKSTKLPWNFQF